MSNNKNSSTKGTNPDGSAKPVELPKLTLAESMQQSRSKIDALFTNSAAKVRVKAADDGKTYSSVVSAGLVDQFAAASQQDAFVALTLSHADSLKRASKTYDAAANAISISQDAVTK